MVIVLIDDVSKPFYPLTDTFRKWSELFGFLDTLLSNKTTNFLENFAPPKSGTIVSFFGLTAAASAIKFYGSRAGIYICYDSGYGRVREREMK